MLKWLKPEKGQISIFYRFNHDEHEYVPDFLVETEDRKYLCEPKQTTAMNDPFIGEKKRAAEQWCRDASEHAKQNNGKPWSYMLIPHDEIKENMTLARLAAKFESHS